MSRERKVHEVILPRRTCGAFLRGFIWNIQTTHDPGAVTCLVCLYHLGLYVPLVKLREHQNAESAGRARYGKRDPYYAPQPHCMGCGRLLVPFLPGGLMCPIMLTHGVSCVA